MNLFKKRGVQRNEQVADVSDFERMAAQHYDLLYTYAVRMTGDIRLAGELLTETCVQAFKVWREGTAWEDPRLEMLKTMRRLLKSPHSALLGGHEPDLSVAGGAPLAVCALLALPEEDRSAVVLRDIGKLAYQEIAVVLGCTEEKAQAYLGSGRKQIAAGIRFVGREFDRVKMSATPST